MEGADEEDESDEAEDDGGDTCEEFDEGFEDEAEAFGGDFSEEDGAGKAEGDGEDHGAKGNHEGAEDSGADTILFVFEDPFCAEDAETFVLEGGGRLLEQEVEDEEDNKNREGCRNEEDTFYGSFFQCAMQRQFLR